MAVPSELEGDKYLCQIVKLYTTQQMLRADLVLGGDTAYPADHRPVIALQAMQIRRGMGSGFACTNRKLCLWMWWDMSGVKDGQDWIWAIQHSFLVMEVISQQSPEDKQSPK